MTKTFQKILDESNGKPNKIKAVDFTTGQRNHGYKIIAQKCINIFTYFFTKHF